jgi:redox-sensitive bicupin YhaK (pirin superfamily)
MSRQIEIERVVKAIVMSEGAGAEVRRLFPTQRQQHVDPFVLMDEFTVDPTAGFPEHPHGGFEAVTYMLEGAFRHRDSLGNDQTVSAGGVQRFTAGKRIVHAELPGSEETSHGLQLWVNLPQRLKKLEPDYQPVPSDETPQRDEDSVRVRTVVGEGSPVALHTDVRYADVTVESAGVFTDEIPEDWNGLIYVLDGEVHLGDVTVERGKGAIFRGGGEVRAMAKEAARFVMIAGAPHGEPIRQRGSFVE